MVHEELEGKITDGERVEDLPGVESMTRVRWVIVGDLADLMEDKLELRVVGMEWGGGRGEEVKEEEEEGEEGKEERDERGKEI